MDVYKQYGILDEMIKRYGSMPYHPRLFSYWYVHNHNHIHTYTHYVMIRLSNALVAEGREKQMWYSLSSTEERLLSIDCVLDRLIMQKKKIDARMEGELQK